MYRLLSGRYVSSMETRWLHNNSNLESPITALSAVSMSPSLNPSLVLHNEIRTDMLSINKPNSRTMNTNNNIIINNTNLAKTNEKRVNSGTKQSAPKTIHIINRHSNRNSGNVLVPCTSKVVTEPDKLDIIDNFHEEQPIEQLQDRLRWVQQQLEEPSTRSSQITDAQKLSDLRKEFCVILKHLKKRCSHGDLGLSPSQVSILSGEVDEMENENIKLTSLLNFPKAPIISRKYDNTSGLSVKGFITEKISTFKHQDLVTTGDFDEDPDFYIAGQPGTDEEYEYINNDSVSDFTNANKSTTSGNTVYTMNGKKNSKHRSINRFTRVIESYRNRKNKQDEFREINTNKDRFRSQKYPNSNRSVRSKRQSEMAYLNLVPNRRGSLTSPTDITDKSTRLITFTKKHPFHKNHLHGPVIDN